MQELNHEKGCPGALLQTFRTISAPLDDEGNPTGPAETHRVYRCKNCGAETSAQIEVEDAAVTIAPTGKVVKIGQAVEEGEARS